NVTTLLVSITNAYGSPYSNPLRKIYYNMTTTGLSVIVALVIGTIEYLQVAAEKLQLDSGFFTWLGNLNFETLGYWIVGMFVAAWFLSVGLYKVRRVEERWGGMIRESPPAP